MLHFTERKKERKTEKKKERNSNRMENRLFEGRNQKREMGEDVNEREQGET